MSEFSKHIIAFNHMYDMPIADAPTIISSQRLRDLKSILAKELDEIDDVIVKLEKIEYIRKEGVPVTADSMATAEREALTDLADLLGDLQVYCASEMCKWGLPLDNVLAIIMESNFSKMGANGNPIYDEQGKLQKGPNYWKPEPRISALLESERLQAKSVAIGHQAKSVQYQAAKLYAEALGLKPANLGAPPAGLRGIL